MCWCLPLYFYYFFIWQNLVNLKEIDLSYSRQLKKLPDLSQARNLENLLLKACSSLVETHSSIQYLSKLVTLDMSSCKNLNSLLSSLCKLISLQRLYLSGCSNLRRIPESIINLSKLELLHLKNCSKLLSLPELQCNLFSVGVRRCTSLEALSSFSILFSATSPLNDQYLNLSDCLKLGQNDVACFEIYFHNNTGGGARECRGGKKCGIHLLPAKFQL